MQISEPVKHIGVHTIEIQLHPELLTSITVNVAMTSEEAKLQLKGDKKDADESQKSDVAEEAVAE